jgi:hypothetical protein
VATDARDAASRWGGIAVRKSRHSHRAFSRDPIRDDCAEPLATPHDVIAAGADRKRWIVDP